MNEAVHLVILVTPKKSACLGESIKLTQKKKKPYHYTFHLGYRNFIYKNGPKYL